MFKPNSLFYSDGYKIGHKFMLAPGTQKLYGTWIPRSMKYGPKGATKIVSFGQQLTMRWLHDEFTENFFMLSKQEAMRFGRDMSMYLGLDYDASHFGELHDLGYLPIRVKSLPEGIETLPNIPHMTFVNTVDGFAWLTLYLETIVSSLAWKPSTSATIALQYRRNVTEWVMKTDPSNAWLIPFMCHDFSARGLSPWDMLSSGLGHASSFRGSDTLIVIPGARYFYGESEDEVCINSVNASEHSVSTTKIFTVGEKQMIMDWLRDIPNGIFSMVCDTFSTWDFIDYLKDPVIREMVLNRNGKLVVRPDSGDPVDILCGYNSLDEYELSQKRVNVIKDHSSYKGVVELLWDIFGGTVNEQGFKVLDPHIGAIYGDSITLDRQVQIYDRLAKKGFAVTNVVLGVGSYTYQMNTRDSLGFAAKGAWFEVMNESGDREQFNIYKDPITDKGSKKSLKGMCAVHLDDSGEFFVQTECTHEQEMTGVLKTIYENGEFFNQTTLSKVRENLEKGMVTIAV
jgi:nicotinamide phosphoribosyltransferase